MFLDLCDGDVAMESKESGWECENYSDNPELLVVCSLLASFCRIAARNELSAHNSDHGMLSFLTIHFGDGGSKILGSDRIVL